ncbi:MAG: GAF domain-containing protein, partial [Myxococcales bacterium]|nr:GAF domain-containing protein [Myxococcales bacterium]
MYEKGVEELREALIDLERAKNQEARARLESEVLLDGLRILALSDEPEEILAEIFELLRRVVGFEEGVVLRCQGSGELCPVASTSADLQQLVWKPAGLTRRVLQGRPVAVFDVAAIAEWRAQPEAIRERIGSALHLSLQAGSSPAIMVLTHREQGFFAPHHVRLASRFSTLATEALRKS